MVYYNKGSNEYTVFFFFPFAYLPISFSLRLYLLFILLIKKKKVKKIVAKIEKTIQKKKNQKLVNPIIVKVIFVNDYRQRVFFFAYLVNSLKLDKELDKKKKNRKQPKKFSNKKFIHCTVD